MNILVTGGAGYIGSHTVIKLVSSGHSVVVVDNLVNSSLESLHRVEKILGKKIPFYEADLCDQAALDIIFSANKFDIVVHFAGLKSVGESVQKPIFYYRNNLGSTLSLLESMHKYDVKKLVFSSSATVYGTPQNLPLNESSPIGINLTNPYGKTKYFIEEILQDSANADSTLQISILRYFNPIGAHSSGLIGEDPSGPPNNLMPFISQVAVGRRDKLMIFGDDYDTADGTGVRDYIHVDDLASGHAAAVAHLKPGIATYNLGTGKGTSVFELIDAFELVTGKKVPYEIMARRPGDIASCYADVSKAQRDLGWKAKKTIEDACRDSWLWQSKNPNGYRI